MDYDCEGVIPVHFSGSPSLPVPDVMDNSSTCSVEYFQTTEKSWTCRAYMYQTTRLLIYFCIQCMHIYRQISLIVGSNAHHILYNHTFPIDSMCLLASWLHPSSNPRILQFDTNISCMSTGSYASFPPPV